MFIRFMNSVVNRTESYYFVKIIDLTLNRRVNYYFYENCRFHFKSKSNLLFLWKLFISRLIEEEIIIFIEFVESSSNHNVYTLINLTMNIKYHRYIVI